MADQKQDVLTPSSCGEEPTPASVWYSLTGTPITDWKDPVQGIREIHLEGGAQGVLLTVCGDRSPRRTADGRSPVYNSTHYFDVAVHQVRTMKNGSSAENAAPQSLAPPLLDADDVTILTGWAEALAEALAHAPEYVEALIASANAGAPWRASFRIPEPSQPLSEAISVLAREVEAATPTGSLPTLDALLNSCLADRPGEQRLDSLVCRVLRSTLEQLRTRQAAEAR